MTPMKHRLLAIFSFILLIGLFFGSKFVIDSKKEISTQIIAAVTGTTASLDTSSSTSNPSPQEPILSPLPQKLSPAPTPSIFEPQPKYIKLLFLGDIMLGRYVRTLMDKNRDPNYAFAKAHPATGPGANFLGTYFDRVIANLEGPIVPKPNYAQTGTNFGFAPDTAQILKNNGIDIVSLANNHTLDQKQNGLSSTLDYLQQAKLKHFGHPILPIESDTLYETINGKKFAFLGFHDATHKLDEQAAAKLIQKISPTVDYTIIYIHWGPEYQKTPSKRQQQLAHLFIDSGASLTIGHHPHIPQTIETYNGVPIVYSLGNFIFDQYWSDMTQHGLTIEAVFSTDPLDPTIQIFEHPIDLYKSQPVWK